MSEWSMRDSVEDFERAMPPHECGGAECEKGSAFYMMADQTGTGLNVWSGVHSASAAMVAEAMVRAFDNLAVENCPDDMPASIAWTQGRELLKVMCEQVAPPGDVSMDLSDLMRKILESRDE